MTSKPIIVTVENVSRVEDEVTGARIPKPDFDPFERLLKPMLEQDAVQCNAWKEEVQNILIFAGLFSAVVTAFIIESYQQLLPDPNDAIVGLLAHIAQRLDNPSITGTASISSIASDTNFSPSPLNISINVFWFISLVLSLTAALIGIIILQWLREHQRYDNTLKPQETMAMLNSRLDSLQEWYVPHIFAGLPLPLQGALVLFFAGLVEFLFALRLEVAIPVTFAICVPLVFLLATTVLPLLQVFILQDPFRLSISDKLPSPCPYKSPQSLICRRIGVHSKILFNSLASIVAGIYVCVVKIICLVRRLAGYRPPAFHSAQQSHRQAHLRDVCAREIRKIRHAYVPGAHWTSIDMSWLNSRTMYALSLQTLHREDDILVGSWTAYSMVAFSPEVHDCIHALRRIQAQGKARVDDYALYHCVVTLFYQAHNSFQGNHLSKFTRRLLDLSDLCFFLGKFLCDVYSISIEEFNPLLTAVFIEDAIYRESPDGTQSTIETLCAAFLHASWAKKSRTSLEPAIRTIAHDGAVLLITNRLRIRPERLFAMSSGDMWLPWMFRKSVYSGYYLRAPSMVNLLHTFLEHCSMMQVNSQHVLHPAPASKTYGGIAAYMYDIVLYQPNDTLVDTWAYLTHLCTCNTAPDLIRTKPFLMIATCFYLSAVIRHYHSLVAFSDRDNALYLLPKFQPLLHLIVEACGIRGGNLSISDGWTGLDEAIDAVYNHGNPSNNQPTNCSGSFIPSDSSYILDNGV